MRGNRKLFIGARFIRVTWLRSHEFLKILLSPIRK